VNCAGEIILKKIYLIILVVNGFFSVLKYLQGGFEV
jgi:hypothetical protein